MRLLTIDTNLETFDCYSLGFEIGTWYALISFAKWSLEIRFDVGE